MANATVRRYLLCVSSAVVLINGHLITQEVCSKLNSWNSVEKSLLRLYRMICSAVQFLPISELKERREKENLTAKLLLCN